MGAVRQRTRGAGRHAAAEAAARAATLMRAADAVAAARRQQGGAPATRARMRQCTGDSPMAVPAWPAARAALAPPTHLAAAAPYSMGALSARDCRTCGAAGASAGRHGARPGGCQPWGKLVGDAARRRAAARAAPSARLVHAQQRCGGLGCRRGAGPEVELHTGGIVRTAPSVVRRRGDGAAFERRVSRPARRDACCALPRRSPRATSAHQAAAVAAH